MDKFKKELEGNILHFWMGNMVDDENGGFYGAIDGDNHLQVFANKGIIMNARVLWTFSAAFRVLKNPKYLIIADRAFNYIITYFIDKINGGVYWELDYLGIPVNKKKQSYAQAFTLYAFTEYYRVTQNKLVLELAIAIFERIEQGKDLERGGYWEAFTENWEQIEDMRLSEKDENEAKTMNTHLHILESYTNLIRVWPDQRVINAQHSLIDIFINKIYNPQTGHLNLFFDSHWNSKVNTLSYGHDIEAAWLLLEASILLGDERIIEQVKPISLSIAQASTEGLLQDGSMAYELKNGNLDVERHWWVQAEAVVGFQYMTKVFEKEYFQDYSLALWSYIQDHLVDKQNGEWYWSVHPDGSKNTKEDKAGFWKCPYHNGRMCLEMIENFNN